MSEQVLLPPAEPPLYPESYLRELTTAYGWLLEASRDNPRHVMDSLRGLHSFLYDNVRPSQQASLGRRILERVVGEGASSVAITGWLTASAEQWRTPFITGLAEDILGPPVTPPPAPALPRLAPPAPAFVVPRPASPPPVRVVPKPASPPAEAAIKAPVRRHLLDRKFKTATKQLTFSSTAYAVAAFAAVGPEQVIAAVDHMTGKGSEPGRAAVQGAAQELQRMLDQYHDQASDELKNDARYQVVQGLVKTIIGYGGQVPRSLTETLRNSPYAKAEATRQKAAHLVGGMLKEVLLCEVNRDPERNTTKLYKLLY